MRKKYFNMIEILLAIAVIAIGITSVMGLFSSGLRVGTNATLENNTPNFTEALLSHVRLCALNYGTRSDLSEGWKLPSGSSSYAAFPKLSNEPWKDNEGVSIDDFNTGIKGSTIIPVKDNAGGSYNPAFLYRQFGGTDGNAETVFSAIAEVRWVHDADSIEILKPKDDSLVSENFLSDSKSENSEECSRRVFEVRISYPADAAPAAREKKFYRLDVYNDKYDRFICEREEDNATP